MPKSKKALPKKQDSKKTKSFSKKKSSKPKSSKKKEEKEQPQRIRIKIKAYDHRIIDESARKIVNNVLRQGAQVLGPVPLPTEIHKWTVNRSTFVHKDARNQYEMRIHKRLIDILNPTPKIIDSLMNLDLPSGVDVEIKS